MIIKIFKIKLNLPTHPELRDKCLNLIKFYCVSVQQEKDSVKAILHPSLHDKFNYLMSELGVFFIADVDNVNIITNKRWKKSW